MLSFHLTVASSSSWNDSTYKFKQRKNKNWTNRRKICVLRFEKRRYQNRRFILLLRFSTTRFILLFFPALLFVTLINYILHKDHEKKNHIFCLSNTFKYPLSTLHANLCFPYHRSIFVLCCIVCVSVCLLFISLSLIFVFMSIHIGSAHNVFFCFVRNSYYTSKGFARYTNIAL